MACGIYLIQPMCQHTHRLKALFQRMAMSTDIYAVSQSADDEHLRTQLAQVFYKPLYQVLAVLGATSRTYYINNVLLVEVG